MPNRRIGDRVENGRRRRATREKQGEIANEFFRVTADPTDGTLRVEDLRGGTVLRGLNRFLDGGDRGDEYNYCPPDRDELVLESEYKLKSP